MRSLLFVLLILLYSDSFASDASLLLSPGVRFFDYTEYGDNGNFLDGETGPVWGAELSYSYPLHGNATLSIDGDIFSGNVRYDGSTQGGTPLVATTNQNFYSFGLGYKTPFIEADDSLTVLAALRYERWERDILPTTISTGLFELYEWWEMSLGFEFLLHKEPDQRLIFYARVFDILDPVMQVHLNRYGKPELELGARGGGEFGFHWMSPLNGRSQLGLALGYKAWSFGRSNDKTVLRDDGLQTQTIFEPRSQTDTFTIQLMLSYQI